MELRFTSGGVLIFSAQGSLRDHHITAALAQIQNLIISKRQCISRCHKNHQKYSQLHHFSFSGERLRTQLKEFNELASSLIKSTLAPGLTINLFSMIAVCGACIVYWMLMTNFTYNTGIFINGEKLRGNC